MPGLPTTLFTDRHPRPEFDDVVFLEQGDPYKQKVAAIQASPYDESLFLDVDTYVVADITDIFELLGRSDAALAHAPVRITIPIPDVPDSFPEFNTGVIGWRRNDRTAALFSAWLAVYDEFVDQQPPSFDQVSLRLAAWRSDAVFSVLPPELNCRFEMAGFFNQPVRVFHGYQDAGGYARTAERFNHGLEWSSLRVHVDDQVLGDGVPLSRARRVRASVQRRLSVGARR